MQEKAQKDLSSFNSGIGTFKIFDSCGLSAIDLRKLKVERVLGKGAQGTVVLCSISLDNDAFS